VLHCGKSTYLHLHISTEINGLYTHCSKCSNWCGSWPRLNTVLNARTHTLQYCWENGCSHTHTHIDIVLEYSSVLSPVAKHDRYGVTTFPLQFSVICQNDWGLKWARTFGTLQEYLPCAEVCIRLRFIKPCVMIKVRQT
jgi:hypothetical protein